MSDETDKSSRTEQPTEKKLKEARRKGGPPRSAELSTTVMLLIAFAVLRSYGGKMALTLADNTTALYTGIAQTRLTQDGVYHLLVGQILALGTSLAPLALAMVIGAVSLNVIQGGASFQTERLSPNFGKLNPLNGLSRIFRVESLVELPKSLLKIAIVIYVAYRVIKGELPSIGTLSEASIMEIVTYLSRISFMLMVDVCMVLLVLASADVFYVRWRYLQNLKMTKQEVKDEARDAEGDPKAKAAIRKAQFRMLRRRMDQLLPQADALITNPTHYAIAIKYDPLKMRAPIVLLKGVDQSALKMRELARKYSVAIVENRPLARELYATVKEGAPIPEKLYAAVAEVLAYVYRLKGPR